MASLAARQLGARLVSQFEGCRLEPYRDSAGLFTIGYGHLLSPNPAIARPALVLTPEQARALLEHDLDRAVFVVRRAVRARLSIEQGGALLSLAFNIGAQLVGSVLAAKLNRGDVAGAAAEFPRWCHAAGRVVHGLQIRRAKERAVFLAAVAMAA